jgi:glycosyltransferase involved in cell wall biosynthesis
MKVVLSVEAIRYPLTGTGRYAFELARHLPQIEEIEELRFFAGGGFVDLPAPAETPNAVTGRLRRALQKSDTIVALRQAVLNARARSSLSDLPDHVFHGPNFYLPPRRGPNVVTIHDLSIFTMPDCHPPERVRYMRREIKLSLERASIIVTDSDFARAEIADYFSWPQDRIRTVALANSPDFRPRTQSELAPVLARHGISAGQYCLFAGTIEPRKNIGRLIGAYGALPQALRERFPLVLVGHAGWRSEDVHRLIEDGERRGFIRYLGYVPGADLPLLYAGARLFALPSLYEGFGLPVLEAMACGVPAVISNVASLPEVAGNAALMIDPQDTDGLAAALRRGLEDDEWRETAASAGLARAAGFSWRRCAQETVDVYRRAKELGQAAYFRT